MAQDSPHNRFASLKSVCLRHLLSLHRKFTEKEKLQAASGQGKVRFSSFGE